MITVRWSDEEGCYLVHQDGTFIYDTDFLYKALEFALAVGDANDQPVTVTSIGAEE